jgi:hypothetical protein
LPDRLFSQEKAHSWILCRMALTVLLLKHESSTLFIPKRNRAPSPRGPVAGSNTGWISQERHQSTFEQIGRLSLLYPCFCTCICFILGHVRHVGTLAAATRPANLSLRPGASSCHADRSVAQWRDLHFRWIVSASARIGYWSSLDEQTITATTPQQ